MAGDGLGVDGDIHEGHEVTRRGMGKVMQWRRTVGQPVTTGAFASTRPTSTQ